MEKLLVALPWKVDHRPGDIRQRGSRTPVTIGLFSGCNGMLPFAICSVGGTPFLKPRPSARTNTQTARRSGFEAAFGQFRHKALRRERA
ncbi:hypothetical protein [Rhizobium leguminosarum]